MPPTSISLLVVASGLALALSPEAASATMDELRSGERLERELARGETLALTVTLDQDQVLPIVVEQHGLDVAVVVTDPAGAQHAIDVAQGVSWGDEPATVGPHAGRYGLAIRASPDSAFPSGRVVVAAGATAPAGDPAATARMEAERELAAAAAAARDARAQDAAAQALARLEQAAARWRALGDRYWTAVAGVLLAEAQAGIDPARAVDTARQSAEALGALSRKSEKARALQSVSTALVYSGRSAASVAPALEAVALQREVGDPLALVQTLNDLGGSYLELGEVARSREVREEALALARSAGDRRREAAILADLGATYWFMGAVDAAADLFVLARAALHEQGNRLGEAATTHNIGASFLFMGEPERAEARLREALPLCRDGANKPCEAHVLQSLALTLDVLDRPQEALALYGQAREIRRALGDEEGEAWLLTGQALGHHRRGERERANDGVREAEAIFARLPGGWRQGLLLDLKGELLAESGDLAGAYALHRETRMFRRKILDRDGEAVSLVRLGRLDRRAGRLAEARAHFEEAIRLFEELRGASLSPDRRMGFVAGSAMHPRLRDAYQGQIDVLMELHGRDRSAGLDALAFQASEAAHARVLLEMLARPDMDRPLSADPSLLDQLRDLQDRLGLKLDQQVRLTGAGRSPEELAAAAAETDQISRRIEETRARLRAATPRDAAWAFPQPLDVGRVQQDVLDADSLLLEYALGEQRSYLWAVTRTSLEAYELPGRQDIEAAAREVHRAVSSDRSSLTEVDAALGKLSRLVLAPVAPRLGRQRLLIVADGALHYVPFAALPHPVGPGVRLLERHDVVCLPSASTLAVLRGNRHDAAKPARTIAVLADPVFSADDERLASRLGERQRSATTGTRALDALGFAGTIPRLPFTRREARAIAESAPTGSALVALDFDASRRQLGDPRFATSRVLHLATHGVLSAAHPELSGVLLSLFDRDGRPQQGFFSAADAARLDLAAELVVLSGCRTALGREVNGEGILGLARGFLYAGASRVMASLWKVDDAATASLMKRLYRDLMGASSLSPAAALRSAQLELLRQRRYRHPYYWAGFQLYGEAN
jgi:CHAT domain-containing protein/tetratricopeptide (TPR) repeat protein